jgi:IS605 OrfB family transposase
MNRTYNIFIKKTDENYIECEFLCNISAGLYNLCTANIRRYFFSHNNFAYEYLPNKYAKIHTPSALYSAFSNYAEFRTEHHPDYFGAHINTKVMKQVFFGVHEAFQCFENASKSYRKEPNKFLGKPKLPTARKTRYVTTFPKDAIGLVKGDINQIRLAGTAIIVPLIKITKSQINEIQIVPIGNGYKIVISYKSNKQEKILPRKEDVKYVAGIDIGLNNLAVLTTNKSCVHPVIINGRTIKSINQYCNKKTANLNSLLPKNIHTSYRIRETWSRRTNKISAYLHDASHFVIEYLRLNKIQCLVVGSNKGWKQRINIGKKNNQNFVCIPVCKFLYMLKYKCEEAGILYIENEESYTSKCSFLDMELIEKHSEYKGKRIKRGQFISARGEKINADVNGSYNIIRKVFGSSIFEYVSLHDLNRYNKVPIKVNSNDFKELVEHLKLSLNS